MICSSRTKAVMASGTAPLRGRQAQAAQKDEPILQAAREGFLADPPAPNSPGARPARAGRGAAVTYRDVEFRLESLPSVRLGNASRPAELRQRHLSVIIDGLRAGGRTPLPGRPPTWEEQTQRWLTH